MSNVVKRFNVLGYWHFILKLDFLWMQREREKKDSFTADVKYLVRGIITGSQEHLFQVLPQTSFLSFAY